jgi:hypothetical protein
VTPRPWAAGAAGESLALRQFCTQSTAAAWPRFGGPAPARHPRRQRRRWRWWWRGTASLDAEERRLKAMLEKCFCACLGGWAGRCGWKAQGRGAHAAGAAGQGGHVAQRAHAFGGAQEPIYHVLYMRREREAKQSNAASETSGCCWRWAVYGPSSRPKSPGAATPAGGSPRGAVCAAAC